MKILQVVPGLRKAGGGVSEYVPDLCQALLALGCEVGIAVCEPDSIAEKVERAERDGVRIFRFSGNVGWRNPILFSWGLFQGLETIMQTYDFIQVNANWLFPTWWAAHVARKLGKPYVMMPHGSFAPERLKVSAWKKRLVGWIDRHYARHAKEIWVTAEAEAEGVRMYVPGAKTEVFPIGLDVKRYQVERRGGEGDGGRRTILFFSRISPIKGLDLLAEVWARIARSNNLNNRIYEQWKLLIVGPDDRSYTEEIKKVFAAKCPAGSYEFRGPVYGEEKFELLASADAFVLPTRNENWGIAVAEAMASGLPVVCTKGAPWKCLETEKAGRWVDVSVEGIQRGVEDILALSDWERHAMGERGRRWVAENLDWKCIAERMLRRCEGF